LPDTVIDRIIDSLTGNQKIVLREISRVEKTGSGFFKINSLKNKGKIIKKGIDVESVLEELQTLGLVSQNNPSRQLWHVSRQGKLVEHKLEKNFNNFNYPDLSRIIRR
jgi:Cdc6-like AAA superfamily ATPase